MKIAIDFDGTCVAHSYPEIGKDIGAVRILKQLVDSGHDLILFTMRSGGELGDAVGWFKNNNIQLYGIQEDPSQKIWTNSPKCYAELYIDDAALGIPLNNNHRISHRPFVDWYKVELLLQEKNII